MSTLATRHPLARFPRHMTRHDGEWRKVLEVRPSALAVLCVGVWSLLGYINDDDVKAAAVLPEVRGEEEELAVDWDII